VVFALADILLFRFVIRISLAETVGWVGFVFLQVPRRLCLQLLGTNDQDLFGRSKSMRSWPTLYLPAAVRAVMHATAMMACTMKFTYSCRQQVYPKLYLSGGSMYDAKWWRWLVRGWELTVWNPVLDLDRWGPILLPSGVFAWLAWKLWRRRGGCWPQVRGLPLQVLCMRCDVCWQPTRPLAAALQTA
jgi:hypothetical protein